MIATAGAASSAVERHGDLGSMPTDDAKARLARERDERKLPSA